MDFTNAIPNPAAGRSGLGLSNFDTATAAAEFKPVPPGIYYARVVRGEYTTTKKNGAEAYLLKFEITEGDHKGHSLIRMYFFSEKAIAYTKRDLAPLGLTTASQLLNTFPEPGREYLVQLVVALQAGDDGITRNDIKKFDLLAVKDSPAAAYMLPPPPEGGTQ